MNSWQDSAKLDRIVNLLSAILTESHKQTALLCAVHDKEVLQGEDCYGRSYTVVAREKVEQEKDPK